MPNCRPVPGRTLDDALQDLSSFSTDRAHDSHFDFIHEKGRQEKNWSGRLQMSMNSKRAGKRGAGHQGRNDLDRVDEQLNLDRQKAAKWRLLYATGISTSKLEVKLTWRSDVSE